MEITSPSPDSSPEPPEYSPVVSTEEDLAPLIENDDDDREMFSDSSEDDRYTRNEGELAERANERDLQVELGRISVYDPQDEYPIYGDLLEEFLPRVDFADEAAHTGLWVSIADAEDVMNKLKQDFPPDLVPNNYTYRDSITKQLIKKFFSRDRFIRYPWPVPYVRKTPRVLGTEKIDYNIHIPDEHEVLQSYGILVSVYRSRPNYYIHCSEVLINYCGVLLSLRAFMNPINCAKFIVMALNNLLDKNVREVEIKNSTDATSVWFQLHVTKPLRVNPKELSRFTLTTDIITIPWNHNRFDFFILMASVYLASYVSWKIQSGVIQDYFEAIMESDDKSHIEWFKMFIVNDAPSYEELNPEEPSPPISDNDEMIMDEEDDEQAGCKGYFGNKYISHRLTRYVIDPQSTYNNCLFYCIYTELEYDGDYEKKASQDRFEMNIKPGSKIALSQMETICDFYKLSIWIYKIMNNEQTKQKDIDLFRCYDPTSNTSPKYQDVHILLNAGHFCLIKNVPKLLEFKSCANCYDWFNSNTKRGIAHFAKCRKCDKCGLKFTKNHNCRVIAEWATRKKPVRFDKKIRNAVFEGFKGFYSADFETLQIDTEMEVYAAGLVKIQDVKNDSMAAKVKIFYGKKALDNFCNHLLSLKEKVVVVFYNGARFDFWFILRWVLKKKITVTRFIRENKSNKLMSLEFANVKLWDLCLFTMTSLKQLCIDLNINKRYRKGEFDHSKIKSWDDVDEHKKEAAEYLYFDVMALALCHIVFTEKSWELYKHSVTKCVTLSHFAFDVWRNKFIDPENLRFVKIPTEDEWNYLRRGLFGGRTMAYRKGYRSRYYVPYKLLKVLSQESQVQLFHTCTDFLVYLDVVSLYPYVSRFAMPIGNARFMDEKDIKDIYDILSKNEFTSYEVDMIKRSYFEVDVTCPKNLLIPFLLARGKRGELEANLLNKEKQVYDGDTILEAIILGYIITKVHNWLLYPRTGVVLESYMSHCFEHKAKHKKEECEYHIHKGMMNNLTGKFSQCAIENDQYFFTDDGFMKQEKELGKFKRIEWMRDENNEHLAYYVETKKQEKSISKPSNLGVFILSKSRVLMSEYTRVFNGYYEPDNCPYYCDTDSLIVHNDVYLKYSHEDIFGSKWGQLKDELGSNCKIVAAYFPAPKTYALEYWCLNSDNTISVKWYIRAKGIPKGEISCSNAKSYEELNETLKDRPDELKEALFTLYTRDGFKKETRNTLPFYFFEQMMLNNCYVVAHFGALKKYLLDDDRLGCTVKLNLDLHRTINQKRWWDNGKRIIPSNNIWGYSVPAGHYKVS